MKASILATLAATLAISCANAQEVNPTKLDIDCAELKGKPQVCLYNFNDRPVTTIECETVGTFGGKGTKPIRMPAAGIPAHSFRVVTMDSCKTSLIFTISGGQERRIDKVDTDRMTVIEVPVKK